jgi:hypothetical protein
LLYSLNRLDLRQQRKGTMDIITAELAAARGIPPSVAAYLNRFPDDDASIA